MTDLEFEEKFRSLASTSMNEARMHEVIDSVYKLDKLKNI